MLALEKIVASFLSLPGLFFLLLFIITIYLLSRTKNSFIKLLATFTLLLMYFTFTALGSLLILFPLENRYQPVDAVNGHYLIVVLGGGLNYLDEDKAELNAVTLQRLVKGYQLFQQIGTRIIFSGGVGLGYDIQISEASLARDWLEEMGVNRNKVILEDRARTTYENGVYVSRWLQEKGLNRVFLVTSAVHLPRATAVFEKQGVEVIPVPAGYMASHKLSWLDFLPGQGSLTANLAAIHEWLGIIWYRLTGRI